MNRLVLLSTMLLMVLADSVNGAQPFDHSHGRYARVLSKHVKDGKVDYGALKADPSDLDAYLKAIAAIDQDRFASWTKEQQLALLINLYNAQTLKMIVERYPIKSIRKIGFLPGAAWRIDNVHLGGKVISLGHLEHEIIRVEYDEPRIHFALVCAANGCPPLRSEPYVATRLDEQLNEQGKLFMADAEKNRFDAKENVLWLSPLFKWYDKDFLKAAGSLEKYVLPFLPESSRKALAAATGVRVKYTDYDWILNDLRD